MDIKRINSCGVSDYRFPEHICDGVRVQITATVAEAELIADCLAAGGPWLPGTRLDCGGWCSALRATIEAIKKQWPHAAGEVSCKRYDCDDPLAMRESESGEFVAVADIDSRVAQLEKLVCVLALGILQHEYSKDLCRHGTEDALLKLANDEDLPGAILEVRRAAGEVS
jgi:hypothetical protein